MKSMWISDIKGFEECKGYKVYEDGTVESYFSGRYLKDEPQRVLKPYPNTKGYPMIDAYPKRAIKVHRLVAIAFIPNLENKPQVNHVDGIKTNNHISNLEWVTNSENQKHAHKLGLQTVHREENNYQYSGNHSNCKSVRQLSLDGEEIAIHKSLAIAGRSVGKGYTTIAKVCVGQGVTAYGYRWEFVNR